MGGWIIVMLTVVALMTGAHWYVRGGGVAAYRGPDEAEIRRVRAQHLHGGMCMPH